MKPLFILGCIPARLALAYAASKNLFSPWLQTTFLVIGFGFLSLYATNSRLNAPEGGGVTWWAPYRAVHGILYLAAAAMLFLNKPADAGRIVLVDTLLGLLIALHK